MRRHITLYYAEDLDPKSDQLTKLQAELQRSYDEPDYSGVANFAIVQVIIGEGDLVVAEDASESQTEFLRDELDLAWEDPSYIAVVPFKVHAESLNRGNLDTNWGDEKEGNCCSDIDCCPGDAEVVGTVEIKAALNLCIDALDGVLGDTDMDGDDSIEYRAMQAAVGARQSLEKASAKEGPAKESPAKENLLEPQCRILIEGTSCDFDVELFEANVSQTREIDKVIDQGRTRLIPSEVVDWVITGKQNLSKSAKSAKKTKKTKKTEEVKKAKGPSPSVVEAFIEGNRQMGTTLAVIQAAQTCGKSVYLIVATPDARNAVMRQIASPKVEVVALCDLSKMIELHGARPMFFDSDAVWDIAQGWG